MLISLAIYVFCV